MKLIDLEPKFVTFMQLPKEIYDAQSNQMRVVQGEFSDGWQEHDNFAEADGLYAGCPKCTGNGSWHPFMCWFHGRPVPPQIGRNKEGKTVRWTVSGTGYSDLTLTPSILLQGDCGWHGFITAGEVLTC